MHDAFRLGKAADNQEYVLAKAKKRFLIVLSPDVETKRGGVHQLVVAPTYTLHEERNSERAQEIRDHSSPHTFYLRADPNYPDVGECYLDFRQIQPIHRKWLEADKLGICLASWVMKAVLFRFKSYLLIR